MTRSANKAPHPRWTDRVGLRLSKHTPYDGLTISVLEGRVESGELATRVKSALALLREHDPRCYRRLKADCERIWVRVLAGTIGGYIDGLRAICLDERFVASHMNRDSDIAATIVHEAMHARLCSYGIVYGDGDSARIERACFRREVAFASMFPESAFITKVKHLQALPDTAWSPHNLNMLRLEAMPGALNYLGTSSFSTSLLVLLARLISWSGTILQRVRRGRAA